MILGSEAYDNLKQELDNDIRTADKALSYARGMRAAYYLFDVLDLLLCGKKIALQQVRAYAWRKGVLR